MWHHRTAVNALKDVPTHGGVRNTVYFEPAVTWRGGAWAFGGLIMSAWMDEPSEPLDGLGIDASMGEPPNARRSPAITAPNMCSWADDENWAGLGLDLGFFVPGEALDAIPKRRCDEDVMAFRRGGRCR